ncbi:MAG: hypothetical protein NTY01_25630, partial [Verrucomicrobia bacterium]|nr:hypothetical protein [Verrucomicrobiota bacterium]
MKIRTSSNLWAAFILAGCVLTTVSAQNLSRPGPGGGPPAPAQELQMNIGVLTKLRADPQA